MSMMEGFFRFWQITRHSLRHTSKQQASLRCIQRHQIPCKRGHLRPFSGAKANYAKASQSEPNQDDIQKRKVTRVSAQTSLRKTALEAQRSRANIIERASTELQSGVQSKVCPLPPGKRVSGC